MNISADTERGEATGLGGIVGAGVGLPGKSNLAKAGGNIMADKGALLKKKSTTDQT